MTRTCSICSHPQRAAIDTQLVAGTPYRSIANQFAVSPAAVFRHKEEHIPAALTKAREAEDIAQALDVVKQLRHINGAALMVLRDARNASDGDLTLKAVDRVLRQVELQAKLLGDLDDRPQVNVLISPEWVALRAQIVRALAPFPAARQAVAEVLAC